MTQRIKIAGGRPRGVRVTSALAARVDPGEVGAALGASRSPGRPAGRGRAARRRRPLPATYRGAAVVRGRGVHYLAMEQLEGRALRAWTGGRDLCVVLPDDAVRGGSCEVRVFDDAQLALRYARGLGNGNVDHRVLRVVAQTLVVATDNDLDPEVTR